MRWSSQSSQTHLFCKGLVKLLKMLLPSGLTPFLCQEQFGGGGWFIKQHQKRFGFYPTTALNELLPVKDTVIAQAVQATHLGKNNTLSAAWAARVILHTAKDCLKCTSTSKCLHTLIYCYIVHPVHDLRKKKIHLNELLLQGVRNEVQFWDLLGFPLQNRHSQQPHILTLTLNILTS